MNITIDDDFDLDKIIDSGQCFRPKKTGSTYRFVTGRNVVDIRDLTDPGSKCDDGHPTSLSVSCSRQEWEKIWHPYFDLDTDYRQIRQSIPADDEFLSSAARYGTGIRILRQDRFETLISFIISQRKSIPAIRTSVERIVATYGSDGYFPDAEDILAATCEELSACGLGYRCSYVYNAAKRVARGEVDLERMDELTDEELFNELKSFDGVGDKVANCVALFAYHRTGRAPVDTWIAKVINEEYGGINPFGRYGNVAGIMQQYMFYSKRNNYTFQRARS